MNGKNNKFFSYASPFLLSVYVEVEGAIFMKKVSVFFGEKK